eukprot:TRINITY_DN11983_c0_g1_i2.p1 TRINITY_DN11983_c0_g1~~TRINITY_DN11983_c0_g1_i2.p1  ORF type:complete len:420 (-),score=90.02 TRINITY_DN11983_c0_g1_i2:188-1447(-)
MKLELEVVILRSESEIPGDEMRITMDPTDTVLNLKQIIEEMDELLAVDRQRLIWGGRQLADAEILENVFRRVTSEEGPPKVRLTMRRYGALSPGATPTVSRTPSNAAPPPPVQPAEPEPAVPNVCVASARAQMQTYMMHKAYWAASAEYGTILAHAAQLGHEVPFETLFRPQSVPGRQHPHQPHNPQQAPPPNPPVAPQPPMNPEDAEIAREIAAAEAQQNQPAFERHIKLAIKLAFFVLMLSQDASSERLMLLSGIAMFIFIVQTGAARYLLDMTGVSWVVRTIGATVMSERRDGAGQRGGFFFEINLFVVSLLATLVPGVHPPAVDFGDEAEPEGGAPEGAAPEGVGMDEVGGAPEEGDEDDEWDEDGNDIWTEMDRVLPPNSDDLYATDSAMAATDCSSEEEEDWEKREQSNSSTE